MHTPLSNILSGPLAEWFTDWLVNEGELVLRLLIAAILGGLIGLERGAHGRSAGLRTQMLVAMGSATAMLVSLHFADIFGSGSAQVAIRVDPARTAYGVMSGVGFLGAGAIMRFGVDIRGLTTAASLWCTAAVGLAAGFGMYSLAISATVLVLVVLAFMRLLDDRLPHPTERELSITISGDPVAGDQQITEMLRNCGIKAVNTGISTKITRTTRTTRDTHDTHDTRDTRDTSDTSTTGNIHIKYLVRMKRATHPAELAKILGKTPNIVKFSLH